jgi:DNA-directed RNA polymerase specialized sigma24 family protein
MGDTPSARSTLEQALTTDAHLRDAILALARKRTRSDADAEDLAQNATFNAIRRSRATGQPPPPPELKRCLLFVGSYLNGQTSNARRGENRHPRADRDVYDPRTNTATSKDALDLQGEHRERLIDEQMERELLAILDAEDAAVGHIARSMIELSVTEEIRTNTAFAKRIGCSLKELLKARERMKVHAPQVRARVQAAHGEAAA